MPDWTPSHLPSVQAPLVGAWSRQCPREPGPAPPSPPPPTPPSLRGGAPPSPPPPGPGTDLPALGPRLWGPAPAPGSLGGGLGALLRETRLPAPTPSKPAPPPPRQPCPWPPVPAPSPLMLESVSPPSVQGGGSEGHQGNPGACEGRSPQQLCLQNPSDGPSGHPSAPRPSV